MSVGFALPPGERGRKRDVVCLCRREWLAATGGSGRKEGKLTNEKAMNTALHSQDPI